jgi:hypothetical protein
LFLEVKIFHRLVKTYRKHAGRLKQTGEGVGANSTDGAEETLDFYIPQDGPDHSTPTTAVNLWSAGCISLRNKI